MTINEYREKVVDGEAVGRMQSNNGVDYIDAGYSLHETRPSSMSGNHESKEQVDSMKTSKKKISEGLTSLM